MLVFLSHPSSNSHTLGKPVGAGTFIYGLNVLSTGLSPTHPFRSKNKNSSFHRLPWCMCPSLQRPYSALMVSTSLHPSSGDQNLQNLRCSLLKHPALSLCFHFPMNQQQRLPLSPVILFALGLPALGLHLWDVSSALRVPCRRRRLAAGRTPWFWSSDSLATWFISQAAHLSDPDLKSQIFFLRCVLKPHVQALCLSSLT